MILMTKRLLLRSGFTLLELLIIVGIIATLVSIVFLKTKAGSRFKLLRDLQRKNDTVQIEKALEQAMIDEQLPPTIPQGKEQAKWICSYSMRGLNCTNYPVAGVDLSYLVSGYLPDLPSDPKNQTGSITGYKIYKDGDFFFIIAPLAGAEGFSSS